MFARKEYHVLRTRIAEPRRFIQVVVGPRQVGKSTMVKQVLETINVPFHHATADNVPASNPQWISEMWDVARSNMRYGRHDEYLLVIDEIQKVKGWSEVVKKEWDNDTFNSLNLKVVLLGSSRVLLEKGLSDSLAGRFEEIRMSHWNWPEMKEAFGVSFEEYIYYGGYPGAAAFMCDYDRWSQYIESAIVDATINKDILQNNIILKPALLRQAFELGSAYSGKELSLTKIVGQLQDAGNTTTISEYLRLLSDAGMLVGLQKFSIDTARKRASAPKFQVNNSALRTIYSDMSLDTAIRNPREWGRFYESAIGAHIVANAFTDRYDVYYWRDGNNEVDYIIKKRGRIAAIEVKSNHENSTRGLSNFIERFSPYRAVIVGPEGMPAEDFLSESPLKLLDL